MRPSLNKSYQVSDLNLYNVIITVIKENRATFSAEDLSNIQLLSKDLMNMVPKVLCWLRVDFTPISQPQLAHKEQTHIDPHCIKMASVAMVYLGLDPGKFVRYLAGEYTGQHQDVWRTVNTVKNHVTPKDYEHIKQILLNGCPAQSSNKLEFIAQGNSKTFVKNPSLVWKTMGKEARNSHLVLMDQLLCKFSPYL
jgi:hypothetical protein